MVVVISRVPSSTKMTTTTAAFLRAGRRQHKKSSGCGRFHAPDYPQKMQTTKKSSSKMAKISPQTMFYYF
eukprot:5355502-Pyramimonas_sp.AAC.1